MRHPASRMNFSGPVTSFGSPIREVYSPGYADGVQTVVPSGSYNQQELIDSYAPSCDLSYMLNRLKLGDTSVLTPKTPMYGDFTAVPTSPQEIIRVVTNAQNAFGCMSLADRAKYDNNYLTWLQAVLTGDFAQTDSVVSDAVSADSTNSDGGDNN